MYIKLYDGSCNLVQGREDIELQMILEISGADGLKALVERKGNPGEEFAFFGEAQRVEQGKYSFTTTKNSEYLFGITPLQDPVNVPTVQNYVQVSLDRNGESLVGLREAAVLASGYRRGAVDSSTYLKMQMGRR